MRLIRLVLLPAILFAVMSPAGAAEGQEIERVLTSGTWCMVVKAGDRRSETASFGRDGVAVVSGNTSPGGVARSERFRWRVQRGTLLLSEDGTTWTPVHLQVGHDTSGGDTIVIDGDSYRPCR
ncbi:MAG TPA: hypothetical protein VEB64_16875 [Azospirillaceae bacterium]|nr:hypothetical protein [Azospirillaceae bacterium]